VTQGGSGKRGILAVDGEEILAKMEEKNEQTEAVKQCEKVKLYPKKGSLANNPLLVPK